jgi:hypothetical protein
MGTITNGTRIRRGGVIARCKIGKGIMGTSLCSIQYLQSTGFQLAAWHWQRQSRLWPTFSSLGGGLVPRWAVHYEWLCCY